MINLIYFFLFLLGITSNLVCSEPFTFMSIGDWGGSSIDNKHQRWEHVVANQFSEQAKIYNPEFIIGTGDNFYYFGVKTVDDNLFKKDFENVYNTSNLMVPWYHTLGNHDYAYNPDAQTKYVSPNNNRWVMPKRYYSKRIQLNKNNYASLIFLDTSPCVNDYRNNDSTKWDPCSPNFPTPSDCKFHQNILNQSCGNQYRWLDKTLKNISKNDWIIVAGHHPANEIDNLDLVSLLEKKNIDLYLNGHAHELRYYQINNKGCWITTGAGSMVSTDSSLKKSYKYYVYKDTNFNSLWNQTIAGFTIHKFDRNYSKLDTSFIDFMGKIIYNVSIFKRLKD